MSVNLDNVDPEVIAKYARTGCRQPRFNADGRTARPEADASHRDGRGGEGLGTRPATAWPSRAPGSPSSTCSRRPPKRPRAIWPNDGASTRRRSRPTSEIPMRVSAAVRAHDRRMGGVDLLANNAGGSGRSSPPAIESASTARFADMENDDLLGVVRANLIGVMLMTKAVLMPMIAAGHGHIINAASEGGNISVDGPARLQRAQVRGHGVTRRSHGTTGSLGTSVTCVCPGLMVSERTIRILSLCRAAERPGQLESTFPSGDHRPMLRYRTRSPASSHSLLPTRART